MTERARVRLPDASLKDFRRGFPEPDDEGALACAFMEFPFWGLMFSGALPAAAVEHVGGEFDERLLGFGLAQDVLVHVGHGRDYAEQGQGLAFPDGQPLSVEDDVALVAERIA